MAPPKEEESTEDAAGRDDFNSSLSKFADQRGITLDFNARVNGRHIDLFKIWSLVTSRGGYDAVSSEKLAWRRIGNDFNLGATNAAAYAFALKTLYYKNLVAYEIKTMHGQEPPPVSILEKLTAKGGDTLGRTIENFQPPSARAEVANGASDTDGEGSKTPNESKMDVDEPGSGGGRVTRGLRQAPAPRQLFQPDMSATRQTRHSSGHLQSPQPATVSHAGYNYAASSNPNSASFAIQNYEPRPPTALTLRPITTPGNNPALFKDKQRIARDSRRAELGLASPSTKGMMKPGAGFEGPNIYVRTLQGLRSGVPEEQDYALHHLVKISHERGDKYKFDAFPNLAEGLVEYVLGISSLFYDIKWDIDYSEQRHDLNTLDGISGTPDILQRIECLKRIDDSAGLQSSEFAHKLTKTLEAGLTIRNLSFLEDNAKYLAELPQLRDFLSIALNLPKVFEVVEMKYYALEIAEQVTRFWIMDESDPLFRSLLAQIDEGEDRGKILIALRAVSQISMSREETNLLKGIPASVIQHLCNWVMLDDDDLVSACLDFFYQYTAVPENLALLLDPVNEIPTNHLIEQLARLLRHNVSTWYTQTVATPAIPVTAATEIPNVPDDLLQQFLKYDEPDRSNHWLRAVFEEDPDSHITQIALWQAYQHRFTDHITQQVGLLQAAEFIKNVSTIFAGANAQVVNGPNPKFIIKGIRPRHFPMDPKGRVYDCCRWQVPGSKPCGEFVLEPKDMYDHIIGKHIGLNRNREDGKWDIKADPPPGRLPSDCFWAGCGRFSRREGGVPPTGFELGMHVKMHLPEKSSKASPANPTILSTTDDSKVDPKKGRAATYTHFRQEGTVDAQGKLVGLPQPSALVLRMMARNIPKAAAILKPHGWEAFAKETMERLFWPLKGRFFGLLAHNAPMAPYVVDILNYMEKASAL